jgi:CTP synthase (UTP-ammonia lyase)
VEVALHVPEEIIRRCELAAQKRKADFVIVEIGGTVGEYQNILFMEANRIMKDQDVGNYERFINDDLFSENYVTNGQIYQKITKHD